MSDPQADWIQSKNRMNRLITDMGKLGAIRTILLDKEIHVRLEYFDGPDEVVTAGLLQLLQGNGMI